MVGFEDFDRYCAEKNVRPDDYGDSFARWIAERTGGRVLRFERVEPGDEQILEERTQRELDGVPSFLALGEDEEETGEPETP